MVEVRIDPATAQGPAGPQGPAGAPGSPGAPGAAGVDATYRHQQFTPATTWTVNHNLGKRPTIDIFDSAGDAVDTDFHHVDDNTVTINFTAATGGEAICN